MVSGAPCAPPVKPLSSEPMNINHPLNSWGSAVSRALAWLLGFSAFLPQAISPLIWGLMLLTWVLVPDERRFRRSLWPRSPWPLLLLFLGAWPFVLAAFGPHTPDTPVRLFHMARVVLLLLTGLLWTAQEWRSATQGLLAGAGFMAAVALLHAVWPLPDWRIWHHVLVVDGTQSSRLWILLAAVAGIAASRAIDAWTPHRPKALAWALAGVGAALLVGLLSISRNAHVLVLAIPVVIMVAARRSIRSLLLALWAAAVLAGLAWWLLEPVQARMNLAWAQWWQVIQTHDCASSVGVRWAMSQMALEQMLAHPWLGTGVGSFVPLWQQASQAFCPDYAIVRQPHNDYMLFAMETGVPGLLGLLALLAQCVRSAWQHPDPAIGRIGLVWTTALMITALFNSPLRDSGLGFVMLVLMVASCSPRPVDPRRPVSEGGPSR